MCCGKCRYRVELTKGYSTIRQRECANEATVTTMDLQKRDEIIKFLENWTCDNGSKQIKTVYFRF